MQGDERRKRKKEQIVERDRMREEKPTNDWSDRVPEWNQAQPIGTVGHLWGLVPFIDQVPGLRGSVHERIGRSLSIHPFSALPSYLPLVPHLTKTSYANTTVHGGRATIGQLSMRHLESAYSFRAERERNLWYCGILARGPCFWKEIVDRRKN